MSWVKRINPRGIFVFAIAVMGLVTAGLWFGAQFNSTQANTNNLTLAAAPAATFGGANFGAIPDATTGNCWGAFVPTPRNVTFNVSGVLGSADECRIKHRRTARFTRGSAMCGQP